MYRSSRLVRQPNAPVGINHSNPLAKGIAIAITSQGGATIDAVSGALPASGNGTRAASAYSFGKARQYTSGSDWFLTPASLNAPTRYSWMVRAKFTSISGFNGIFCKTANLGTTNGFGTFRDSGVGDNIVFSHDAAAGTVFEAASNLVNAGLVTIVVTWDGATARYYRDGRFVASGAYTTLVTSGNGYLKVCSNRDTSTTSAYHDHTIVWPGRVLREQEAEYLSLGDNSYSLFTNRRIWVPVSVVTGDPALTGNTATASTGALTPSESLGTTGNQVTGSQGAVAPNLSLATAGNAATSSTGALVASLTIGLTGQGATASAGSIAVGGAGAVALSGNAATANAGTPVASLTVGLLGSASTATVGSVGAPTGDITLALTGSGVTASAGVLGTGAVGVGGYGDDKPRRKKRFVVKVGDKLVEYGSASAAAKALNAAPEAKPEPVAEVPIRKIKAQARVFQAEQQIQNLFKQQDFEAMLALYEQMQDEDDVESLLMAL